MKKLIMFLVLAITLISCATASNTLSIISPANNSLISSYETGLFEYNITTRMISTNQSTTFCMIETENFNDLSETAHISRDYDNNTIYTDTYMKLFQNTINIVTTYCGEGVNDSVVYVFNTEKIWYTSDDIASVTIDSLIRIFLVIGSLITIIIIFIGGLHIMKMLGLRKQ